MRTHSSEPGEDDDLIDFVPTADQLARPRARTESTLPLAVLLAVAVTVIAAVALWLGRGGPAPAAAAPLWNTAAGPAPESAGRVELFALPVFDEAEAARDLAAGRVQIP